MVLDRPIFHLVEMDIPIVMSETNLPYLIVLHILDQIQHQLLDTINPPLTLENHQGFLSQTQPVSDLK